MSTIYDWLTIGLFAALIVLFLQRSTDEGPEADSIWHYLPPSVGCAVTNYFGNEGMNLTAVAVLAERTDRRSSRSGPTTRLVIR